MIKLLVKFVSILLFALLLSVPSIQAQSVSTPAGAGVAQSSESLQVWVNTASGVYHYPGTRWYGNTKQGKFMSEAEARDMDIDQPGTGNENLSDQGNALLDSCGSKRLKFVKGEPTSRYHVSTARVLHLPADLHRRHCCGACNRHSCPGSESKARSRRNPYF